MYSDTTCKIKFSNGVSQPFKSERGVKQGDVLSPILFNFFIDDLKSTLSNRTNTNPVAIGDESVNILMYADDIVLLSENEVGLQNCLDELLHYCTNWKLQVNSAKSKVIVFNSNGRTFLNKFIYDKNITLQFCS